jgi:hypothetical protein
VSVELLRLGYSDAPAHRCNHCIRVCLTWLFNQPALADKRVALVIGNSGYLNVAQLPNPVNDAAAFTALLKGAGFDVVEAKMDLGIADIATINLQQQKTAALASATVEQPNGRVELSDPGLLREAREKALRTQFRSRSDRRTRASGRSRV